MLVLPALVPILMFAVIALVVVAAIYGHKKEKQRQAALAAWAAARGLSFSTDHDASMQNRFPGFEPLRQGKGRYAYNIAVGPMPEGFITGETASLPTRLWAFDYHYYTESTDSKGRTSRHHHHFSAVVIETCAAFIPLHIRPEHFFDKIAAFFGYDDIDFESAEFSRRFRVKSPDRRWAFDVIHQQTMEFLLSRDSVTMEFENHRLAAHDGRRFDPAKYDAVITTAAGVLDRLPVYLLEEMRDTGRLASSAGGAA